MHRLNNNKISKNYNIIINNINKNIINNKINNNNITIIILLAIILTIIILIKTVCFIDTVYNMVFNCSTRYIVI